MKKYGLIIFTLSFILNVVVYAEGKVQCNSLQEIADYIVAESEFSRVPSDTEILEPSDCYKYLKNGEKSTFFKQGTSLSSTKEFDLNLMCASHVKSKDSENFKKYIKAYRDEKEDQQSCLAGDELCTLEVPLETTLNSFKPSDIVKKCLGFKAVALINFEGGNLKNGDKSYRTVDGKYFCERQSEFTADYKVCKNLLIAYDSAFVAEQAMHLAEGIQRDDGIAKAQEKVTKGTAEGKGQTATIDGMRSIAETNETIEIEKASLFSTQLATFSALMGAWPSREHLEKYCKREHRDLCREAADIPDRDNTYFPNNHIKKQFAAELLLASGKTAAAITKQQLFKQQQDILKPKDKDNGPGSGDGDNNGLIVGPRYCEQYPRSPECMTGGGRDNVGGFQGGGFNVGVHDSNDYSITGDNSLGEYNEGGTGKRLSKSDFESLVDSSGSDISHGFDKVGGVKVTESSGGGGGGASGGGGSAGQVGGGSGGGGPSGGDNSKMEVTRSNAKYVSGGGSGALGFSSSKAKQLGQDKKVNNPFNDLLNKKGREIASEADDIAKKESSLFISISKRYSELKKQKRLLE